jgi:hypothetical protein
MPRSPYAWNDPRPDPPHVVRVAGERTGEHGDGNIVERGVGEPSGESARGPIRVGGRASGFGGHVVTGLSGGLVIASTGSPSSRSKTALSHAHPTSRVGRIAAYSRAVSATEHSVDVAEANLAAARAALAKDPTNPSLQMAVTPGSNKLGRSAKDSFTNGVHICSRCLEQVCYAHSNQRAERPARN